MQLQRVVSGINSHQDVFLSHWWILYGRLMMTRGLLLWQSELLYLLSSYVAACSSLHFCFCGGAAVKTRPSMCKPVRYHHPMSLLMTHISMMSLRGPQVGLLWFPPVIPPTANLFLQRDTARQWYATSTLLWYKYLDFYISIAGFEGCS